MIALVLAAGYATRLYPLTQGFPKPLLPVQGKAVLDWLMDDVERIPAVERTVVVSNHAFVGFFDEWKIAYRPDKPLVVVDDGSTSNANRLGAVKDILFAIDREKLDDDLLVLAGDNVLEFSLRAFTDYFARKQASCIMRHLEPDKERLRRTGVAVVDRDDRVLSMEEKPAEPKSTWAVPPFYCFRREDLSLLVQAVAEGCPTDAPGSFISWACARMPVYAMRMPGRRFDIGNLESYRMVQHEYRGIRS